MNKIYSDHSVNSVRNHSSLIRRLWWLDRLNNAGRVLMVALLWAAPLFFLVRYADAELFDAFWIFLLPPAVFFGYITVAFWDARQVKHELREMQRETMERRQVRAGPADGDGFAATPQNGAKLP